MVKMLIVKFKDGSNDESICNAKRTLRLRSGDVIENMVLIDTKRSGFTLMAKEIEIANETDTAVDNQSFYERTKVNENE